jgi:hypothetical protein
VLSRNGTRCTSGVVLHRVSRSLLSFVSEQQGRRRGKKEKAACLSEAQADVAAALSQGCFALHRTAGDRARKVLVRLLPPLASPSQSGEVDRSFCSFPSRSQFASTRKKHMERE